MHVCIQAVFGHFHVKVSHGLKFFRQQQVSCGKHAAGGVLLAAFAVQVVGFSHSCLVIYWMSDGEFAIVSWIARSGLYFSKIFEGGF